MLLLQKKQGLYHIETVLRMKFQSFVSAMDTGREKLLNATVNRESYPCGQKLADNTNGLLT